MKLLLGIRDSGLQVGRLSVSDSRLKICLLSAYVCKLLYCECTICILVTVKWVMNEA